MSDVGDIHHFLGVNVTRNASGMFLFEQQYVLEILDHANMLNCNPISTQNPNFPLLRFRT